MIVFDNVTKVFPTGTVALNAVTFRIDPGEFVFLVGPSGAGKTTVLRLLLRELEPSEGTISVAGKELAKLKKKEIPLFRRTIGAVFQDYKLIDDHTIAENIALVAEIVKNTKEEIEQRVKETLSLVGLGEKMDVFPSQLSGGELQRTAIARALAVQPKILFADEPTGNLDTATAWEIVNLLTLINKNGTTVLVATHNQEIVKSLQKRVIAIETGRIIRDTKKAKEEKKEEKEDKDEREETKNEETKKKSEKHETRKK